MNVWAYCTHAAAESVKNAVGTQRGTVFNMLVSPPMGNDTLKKEHLEGHDFMYIRLHGMTQTPAVWFGESEQGNLFPAFTPDNLDGVSLGGATVVLANCFSAFSPIVPKLIQAGAGAVVLGPGRNFAATGGRVVGADKLAQFMLKSLRRGASPRVALAVAKLRLSVSSWRAADRDAMEFTLVRG